MAQPQPEEPVPIAVGDGEPALEGRDLFTRSPQVCKIISSDGATVNCRLGPGFGYSAAYTVSTGSSYTFQCYKTGDCYKGNW
jgi:uncharacterized protein YraI